MLTVILTTLLMLGSSSVQVTSDPATFIGPPTSGDEVLELEDKRDPIDSSEKVCLACGG